MPELAMNIGQLAVNMGQLLSCHRLQLYMEVTGSLLLDIT